jgi:hypothetical protein
MAAELDKYRRFFGTNGAFNRVEVRTVLKTAMREDGTGMGNTAPRIVSVSYQQCGAELRANFGDGMKE